MIIEEIDVLTDRISLQDKHNVLSDIKLIRKYSHKGNLITGKHMNQSRISCMKVI